MYPRETVELARLLSGFGALDRENAEICGVSISSVRHWRSGSRRSGQGRREVARCPRCHARDLDESAYGYLLGLYLGDGHITKGRRDVYALSIKCCDAWPGLRDQTRIALSAVMPTSRVFSVARPGCTEIKSTSKHRRVCFRSMGPGGSTSAKSSLSRGRRRSLATTPGISLAASFTRTAAGLSTGSGARLRAAIASTSTRGICSSTCPPTYTDCAGRRSTGSGSPGGSPSRRRSRWRGGRRSPGWTSSSARSTDEPGAQAGPAPALAA
jgi:hypothetical protein